MTAINNPPTRAAPKAGPRIEHILAEGPGARRQLRPRRSTLPPPDRTVSHAVLMHRGAFHSSRIGWFVIDDDGHWVLIQAEYQTVNFPSMRVCAHDNAAAWLRALHGMFPDANACEAC